jgi:hypothetical protein
MAEAFGSLAKPVALDMFQRIVNVHWTSPFLLVGFGLRLDMTPEGERGTGPGPALVEPFSEAFVTAATPAYTSEHPNTKVWTGSQWSGVPSTDVTLSGTPDLPGVFSFDAWEVQGITAGGAIAPIIRFIAGTGTAPDVNLPDAATYITELVANGEVVAQNFISLPQPLPIGGDVPLWATFDPTLAQKDTFSMSVAELTATYKTRSYLPIATKVSGNALSVLLKRQPLPPPAP